VPAPPPADPIVRPLPQQHAPSPGDRFALELEPEPEPEAQVSEPVLSESDRHTRITDLLSEADVFFKYGLYQKSRERLGELLGLDPRYIAAHVRLVRLALEEGDENRVLATVLQAQSLADELADLEASAEIQGALEQAGYRVDEGQLIAEATGVHPRLTAEPPRPVAKSARSTPETSARLAPPAPPPKHLGATPEVEPLSKADWLDDILPPAAGASSEGQLFEEEGQFFDLAAELQDDLAEELDRILPAAEPSLEDIVEGFKKGVAENISQEDSDTHYNLGIAYREMLLVDEAIGEFQISARSADYLVESSAMLALCYRDKGMPDLAAKWYQKALASGLAGVEQRLGMLYELGSIHEQLQDREAAYSAYLEVYSANENFRDIAEKVQQFQPAERRT
jgi:tetratricopeptide (TPR) repeat protein